MRGLNHLPLQGVRKRLAPARAKPRLPYGWQEDWPPGRNCACLRTAPGPPGLGAPWDKQRQKGPKRSGLLRQLFERGQVQLGEAAHPAPPVPRVGPLQRSP
eukprot:4513836-Amphidinium_carterae.1